MQYATHKCAGTISRGLQEDHLRIKEGSKNRSIRTKAHSHLRTFLLFLFLRIFLPLSFISKTISMNSKYFPPFISHANCQLGERWVTFLKFKTHAKCHFRDCTGSNRQCLSIEEKLYINLSTIFLLMTEKTNHKI